jgi:hypothetical protein
VAKLAWGVYRHLAAVLGAFSLAVFFGNLFHLGWRGVLADLVGLWDQYVRPPVKWLADGVTWSLAHFFHLHVELPLVVRDYFSVGLVFLLSLCRALTMVNSELHTRLREWRRLKEGDFPRPDLAKGGWA